MLSADRLFNPEPAHRALARQLFEPGAGLPIVSPHGHLDPRLFSNPHATFGSPADLFIIPDHYVTRMLYAQGMVDPAVTRQNFERLGGPKRDLEIPFGHWSSQPDFWQMVVQAGDEWFQQSRWISVHNSKPTPPFHPLRQLQDRRDGER